MQHGAIRLDATTLRDAVFWLLVLFKSWMPQKRISSSLLVAQVIAHVRADFQTLVAVVTTQGSVIDLAVSNLIRPVLALVTRNITVR